MRIQVETEDRYIYDKNSLWVTLYEAYIKDENLTISFYPEGPCAESMGLYSLLDKFCDHTGYEKSRITIETASMVEEHPEYCIKKSYAFWYEISNIQQWLTDNNPVITNTPTVHFSNFMGRARWPRLWLGAWLKKHHSDKILQTFHSSLRCNYRTYKEEGVYDWIGLDDLVQFECDIMPDVIEYMTNGPYVIEEELKKIESIPQIWDKFVPVGTYPIDFPANLNMINFYSQVFVDIIIETYMDGNAFLATEKLWKCMIAKRPFIIMANRDYIHNLHKLGFRSFWQFWSEDYDGHNNQTRIHMIQDIINEIASWSIETCQQKLLDMQDILDHNYDTFINLDKNKFNEVFGSE
jgi:hypothetical protein